MSFPELFLPPGMAAMCMVGLSAFITFQSLAHPSLLVTTVSLEDRFLLVATLNFDLTLFDSGYLPGFCEFMQYKYCLYILCEFIPLLRFWRINVIWKVGMSYISCCFLCFISHLLHLRFFKWGEICNM